MKVIPLNLSAANDFVSRYHRHSAPVRGHRYSLGLSSDGNLVAVVIVGRPVARHLDDGTTAEVTRLCTLPEAPRNACSKLYSAAQRVWFAMGGQRLVTYTLQSESGESLRGAGWRLDGEAGGRFWSTPSRPRVKHPSQKSLKLRWMTP